MLGVDDNVVEAYGVSFNLLTPIHYLDTKRIKLFESDIELGRLLLTSAPEIDDAFVDLPDVSLYLNPTATASDTGGFRIVTNTIARDAIPEEERILGLWVYVIAEDMVYVLIGGITNMYWVAKPFGSSGGSGGAVTVYDGGSF